MVLKYFFREIKCMQNVHVPTPRAEATFSGYELAFPHASSYRENVASARRVPCSLMSG